MTIELSGMIEGAKEVMKCLPKMTNIREKDQLPTGLQVNS